ncbi:reverse transcriptase domain-containing protein [Tanacetum coccineum]
MSLLFNLEEDDMAGQAPLQGPIPDLCSREELLQAPTDGVGDAIVVSLILDNQFELKIGLLNLVTAIAFHGAAQTWLEKEPPNSITTWNDLVSKFIDTFYNILNQSEQDSLNSAANGNFLTKNTQEALTIIENKSNVQTSRNKPQVASASGSSTQDAHITSLNKQVKALLSLRRPVNFVQNGCETCGGPHAYYECQAVGGYTQKDVYATTGGGTRTGDNNGPGTHREYTRVPPLVVQPSLASTSSEIPPAPVPSPVVPDQNPHQPLIPYPSRLNKEKLQDKADIQIHSFLQMFKKIYFNISFAEALAHMPKFAKMVKDLLANKEKLLELENTPLNKNYSAMLLKKLPEKLKDTGRFLIPCDFYRLESCMALADLAGIAEDVFVQVGKFTFPANFVVVNYDVDPRVPLILGRPFLRTAHALVDVHGEELTLRVSDEKLVFNDHFHEVINVQKSINPMSGSPTPAPEPVVASLSPSLTPFKDSDFILEEIDTFLASDDLTSPDDDDGAFDMEGDIRLIETLLNNDISNDLLLPLYAFKINETKKIKTSIDDPPDLELEDLPPHLEYAFLEGTSKLPIIISKDLKREEKEQRLRVLKSHKRAIAWKTSVDPTLIDRIP